MREFFNAAPLRAGKPRTGEAPAPPEEDGPEGAADGVSRHTAAGDPSDHGGTFCGVFSMFFSFGRGAGGGRKVVLRAA